jgi:endonuclease YncB( thermonuclease family)
MNTIVRTLGVVTLTLLAASSLAAQQAPLDPPSQFTASRVRVIEGDTLEVWIDGIRLAVGVVGIKAPPGNTPCGKQAIAAVTALLAGSTWFDIDIKTSKLDKRYRRLYRVTTSNGQSLAIELAREGLASPQQADANARDYPDIVAARTDAQSAQRGCLWAADAGSGR